MNELQNIKFDKSVKLAKQNQLLLSLLHYLDTPIAKRKGVFISSEDCEIWKEEIKQVI